MKIDRKDFLKTTLIAVGATVGLVDIGACGGDDSGGTGGAAGAGGGTGGTPGSGGTAGSDAASGANACATHDPAETILANHGHVLTVSMADAAAGADKTYDIRGTADHPHTVTITTASFGMLRAGMTITMMSSTDNSHSHTVTVVCA